MSNLRSDCRDLAERPETPASILRAHMQVEDAADRCAVFIADIVDVCKKHRVMLKLADMCDFEVVEFEEHPVDDQYGFILGACDIEDAVRTAVWDVLHPSE